MFVFLKVNCIYMIEADKKLELINFLARLEQDSLCGINTRVICAKDNYFEHNVSAEKAVQRFRLGMKADGFF